MSCEREGGESEDSRLTHVGTVVCAGAATQHSSLAVPQKAADRDMLPHRLGGRTILKVRVAMGVVAFASWSAEVVVVVRWREAGAPVARVRQVISK